MILGLLLAAVSIWFLDQAIWLFMVPLSAIALVYTIPLLKTQTEYIRLREVGMMKIFIIVTVWMGMTVILPAIDHQGVRQFYDLKSWWLAIERGAFIMAITIPFDIRDLKNDGKKGIRTIPSSIGVFRSIILAETLLVLFLFLVWWRIGSGHDLFWAYLISALITMLGVSYATPERNDMYCSFWVEGTMMLLTLSAFFVSWL